MPIKIDKLVRAKRRTIALIVERDGSLTVRAPKRAALSDIEQFIQQKSGWIERSREKIKAIGMPAQKQYTDGEKFLFLGNAYELRLVDSQLPTLAFDDGFTLSIAARAQGEKFFIDWYKKQAAQIFPERVLYHARLHGFAPKQIKINSAKTRWGSCGSNGNINFTWRLVMAPLDVIDYVVLHELAHLRVRNHSPQFWKLVASIDANYKKKRKWLRENGETLTL
jgi:predicted metal-dependent hydrolase